MKMPAWITYVPKQGKTLFNTFWRARQKRERKVLSFGFIVVVLLIIYFLLWAPFESFQSQLFNQYESFQSDLPFVVKTLSAYESLKQKNDLPGAISHTPLKSQISQMLVNEQLVPFGIKVDQKSPRQATLIIKQAPFDLLMTGLEKLSKQGIFVTDAKIKRVNHKGIIKGTITVSFFA